MIELITGLPGNSKTLFTISYVKAWAEKDNRQVFYSGIPELTLPWTEIDPEKWMDVPPNSIVVIDEAQRIFRNRSINASAPKYVTDLETHRHLGIDLVFITQHPMLIDPAIRRLTGRHRHLVRIWGMAASTVHEWGSVKDSCDKPSMRKDSEKSKWVFDKSIYGVYKSAEVHTVKRNIPMRLKLLILVPLLLGAAFFYMKNYTSKVGKKNAAASASAKGGTAGAGSAAGSAGVRGKDGVIDPVADAKRFIYESTPRVAGLVHTAPKYDEVTKPTTAPVPVACVASKDRCKCYTQQATMMQVAEPLCREIADKGFFLDFDDNGGSSHKAAQDGGNGVHKEGAVALRASHDDSGQRVVMLGDGSGYGVLGGHGSAKAAASPGSSSHSGGSKGG